jgi:hypothetical protein
MHTTVEFTRDVKIIKLIYETILKREQRTFSFLNNFGNFHSSLYLLTGVDGNR